MDADLRTMLDQKTNDGAFFRKILLNVVVKARLRGMGGQSRAYAVNGDDLPACFAETVPPIKPAAPVISTALSRLIGTPEAVRCPLSLG